MREPRILVVGSSNTDLVVRTPWIPAAGETVLGEDLFMTPGGKGANQAVAAARLDAEVMFLARIGTDVFGDHAVESLAGSGVSTRYVIRDVSVPSGVALISVDASGQNSIVVAPGANARLSPEDVIGALGAFERADIVILQFETPVATVRRAIDLARELGKPVILNPAPAVDLPDGFLKGIDYLTPNRQEAVSLLANESQTEDPKAAAAALFASGVRHVIVTLGADGAVVADALGHELIPGRRVEPVDTTAAGDCFTGALAVCLAEGRSLPYAARFANAAASISVTRAGAQASMPRREEVMKILSEIR